MPGNSLFLLALPIMIFVSGCSPQQSAIPQPTSTAQVTSPPAWTIFRGNPGLNGFVPSPFPKTVQAAWSFQTRDSIKSSPVIYNNTVYIGSSDKHVYALDLQTGKVRWRFKAERSFEAPPLVLEEKIIAPCMDGTVYALHAKDGSLAWKFTSTEPVTGSANWIKVKNRVQLIFGSYDNTLYCLDPKTGKQIWEYVSDNYINGTPAVYKEKIIFGSCDNFCHIVSAQKGKRLSAIDTESYIAGSPAIFNNQAFVGNYAGVFSCLDLDRSNMLWQYELENTAIMSIPALNDKVVVFGARDKGLHCLDRTTGKLLWRFATRGNVDSSPIINTDQVIAASQDGWLYCVNLNDGTEVWSYEIGGSLTGSPAFANQMLVIGSEDGWVHALAVKGQ